MSRKHKKDKHTTDEAPTTETEQNVAEPDSAAEAETPPTPEEQIELLRDEKQRLQAELQNVVKRTQRDKQEALKFAEADFARSLLIVLDDFERTIDAAQKTDDVKAVAEGVKIVYDHFLDVLRGRGIEPIDAADRQFDPDMHEAVMQQPSEDRPAGVVVQEFQRGYVMHGRVIRPTKVAVSSGAPAAPAEEAEKEV